VRSHAFDNCADALDALAYSYKRDRTIGQQWNVYIGVEKNGLVAQLTEWFQGYGVGIFALGGYASQGLVDDVVDEIEFDGRPAVLLYAGDFDPSGEDIDRSFVQNVGLFDTVARVALSAEQVVEYDLPPNPGKVTDSRAAGFVARHGALVQVEVDALPPNILRSLYFGALGEFFDFDMHGKIVADEAADRQRLRELAEGWQR